MFTSAINCFANKFVSQVISTRAKSEQIAAVSYVAANKVCDKCRLGAKIVEQKKNAAKVKPSEV